MSQNYQIRVVETGTEFSCGEDMCVLEAMKRSGGPIRQGCFGGGCGICKMRVLSGDYDVVQKMSRAHISKDDEQVALVCCIVPKTDLVLSAQI